MGILNFFYLPDITSGETKRDFKSPILFPPLTKGVGGFFVGQGFSPAIRNKNLQSNLEFKI